MTTIGFSCSTTKFVPDDKYLLNTVNVESDTKVVKGYEVKQYVSQKPNFKTFTLFKFPLFLYNLAGSDTTKWINRTLQNAGEPPVIFDSLQVKKTVKDLTRMMTNKGYLNATVIPDIKLKSKKADVTYNIIAREPYTINNYHIEMPDSLIEKPELLHLTGLRQSKSKVAIGSMDTLLLKGKNIDRNSIFDLQALDQERDRITRLLKHTGYYAFNKEYLGFEVDTMLGNNKVDVDLILYPFTYKDSEGNILQSLHKQYIVEKVELYMDYDPIKYGDISQYLAQDTYERDGYVIKYGERGRYIKPHIVLANCFIRPGALYNEMLTTHTYAALSQLKILKNVNITYHIVGENLRCIITCVPDKRHGISTELEGTNSGGFFGVGTGIGYLHRNAFRGSELFKIDLKGAYEMVTSKFDNFEENYFEIGGETSLTFPRFMMPFLNREFRKTVNASTQLNAGYTFQRRPGFFTRTVMYTGLKYQWSDRIRTGKKHAVDLIEINYVHLPKDKLNYEDFFDELSPGAQSYSFSDQFIVNSGYTYTQTNLNDNERQRLLRPIYSLRASIETAGNVLDMIAKLTGEKRKDHGSRELFGTKYAQYIRGTFDYSKTYVMDERNSFAWHIGGGLAYPYGNYKEIPIQKRFFSGGGNSLRGWSVRKVGPGSYKAFDKNSDIFFYHSGDIKLDMNIEYRSKLFWVLELGAFIDAGNIWTTKEYQGQEGGKFEFNRFYKEIAASWGLGLRFDFDFVLLRLDCGWKIYDPAGTAINPETGEIHTTEKWPVKYPYKFGDNAALHIAVGYPF